MKHILCCKKINLKATERKRSTDGWEDTESEKHKEKKMEETKRVEKRI